MSSQIETSRPAFSRLPTAGLRVIVAISVVATSLLSSCSASNHAGEVLVDEPSMNETNAEKWLAYWRDQLDAFKGDVNRPTAEKYPAIAIETYHEAREEYRRKEKDAQISSTLVAVGFGIIFVGLVVALAVNVGEASE